MSGKLRPEEAVQATLSSLPDEVVDTVGVTALPSEDSVSERRRKLEYLEMQEELIKVCKSQTSQMLFLSHFFSLLDLFLFFMDHCLVLELTVSGLPLPVDFKFS